MFDFHAQCDHDQRNMRCQIIVIVVSSTMSSREELEENRRSLKRKYEARGQACVEVDYPGDKVRDLKDQGTVGVYFLSHTKDIVPSTLAKWFFDNLIEPGADVRKINIACCKASLGNGPMQQTCTELAKCQTQKVKLPEGLMVCGFNVNVTTFDNNSEFMNKEGTKFQNYAQIKEQAALHNRDVATVKQAWAPVGSEEPSYMYFVHEKMSSGQTPNFILEAEQLFQQHLVDQWKVDRNAHIQKFNNSQKQSRKIQDPKEWSWADFANTYPESAKLYVKSTFWPKFVTCISAVNAQSAAMWVSLDGYIRMKTVMRFDGNAFRPTALSEYTENADLKEALDWVENVGNSKGLNLRFLPDV